MHIDECKNFAQVAIFIVVMFKIHMIDKKLCLLERRFLRK